MRLEFNLLWIEDNREWRETAQEMFSDILNDLGFKLNITTFSDGEEIDRIISDNGFEEFDMMLIDYNLEKDYTGDEIINKIRGYKIYTDVLFYSQDLEKVKEGIKRLELEGVYTANRDGIEEKFESVINSSVKKVQQVNSMRGLIIGSTSVLDDRLLTFIKRFINEGGEASTSLKKHIFKKIAKSLKDNTNKINRYKEEDNIEAVLDSHSLFDAYKRAIAMEKIGSLKGIKKLDDFCAIYKKEVIDNRNKFAHAKEEKVDGEIRLHGHEGVFNHEVCADIRKTLLEYFDLLDFLEQNHLSSEVE